MTGENHSVSLTKGVKAHQYNAIFIPIDTMFTFVEEIINSGGTPNDSTSNSGGTPSGENTNKKPIVAPPTTTATQPEVVEITVETEVDSNGNLIVNVKDKHITDAIAKVKNKANGIIIILKANGSKAASNIIVTLPKIVQETVTKNKILNTVVSIDNPNIKIDMDLSAIKEINAQAQADVSLNAIRIDSSKLTGDAKTAIGSRPAFDFTVVYGNEQLVKDFKGGYIKATLSYTLAKGESEKNIKIVHINEDGTLNWLDNTSYDAKNKTISFETNHFSVFAVADNSILEPTIVTDPEKPTIPAEVKPISTTATPLWLWIIAIVIAISILGGGTYIYIRRKKQ